MAKTGPALAFSRAQAAFSAALRGEIARARLRGTVDPGMGPVLFALEEHAVLTMSALAEAAGVPRSTMTGIAARMEKRGLVRSATNPEDARGIVVALTAKGRAIVPKMRAIEKSLDAAFRSTLPASDVDRLSDYLMRVTSTFTAGPTN